MFNRIAKDILAKVDWQWLSPNKPKGYIIEYKDITGNKYHIKVYYKLSMRTMCWQ